MQIAEVMCTRKLEYPCREPASSRRCSLAPALIRVQIQPLPLFFTLLLLAAAAPA
jgi:hypothetical protein